MDEPRTDPRANDPVPAYVLGLELWHLRECLLEAGAIWHDLGQRHRDPEIRRAAAATARVFYRAVNGSIATTIPRAPKQLPRWRRLLILWLGG